MMPHRFEIVEATLAAVEVSGKATDPLWYGWGRKAQLFVPDSSALRVQWEAWRMGYMLTSGHGRGFA